MKDKRTRSAAIALVLVVLGVLLAVVPWGRSGRPAPRQMAPASTVPLPAHDPASLSRSTERPPVKPVQVGVQAVPPRSRCAQDENAELQHLRDLLGSPRSPQEAIAHSLLGQWLAMSPARGGDAMAAREFHAARRRWPDNVTLAWLSLEACGAWNGCDRPAEIRHLLAVDADNAAAWLVAMSAARDSHDDQAFFMALHRAAAASIYDPPFGLIYPNLRPLLAQLPVPKSCQSAAETARLAADFGRPPVAGDRADIVTIGMEMAMSMPGSAARVACKDDESEMSATVRSDCIAVLSRLAAGDTMIDRLIGLQGLIQLLGDDPRGLRYREEYRQLRWLWTHARRTTYPVGYAARLYSDGEFATWRAYAIEQGDWPAPPDWLPDDARSRGLILDGRPPPESH